MLDKVYLCVCECVTLKYEVCQRLITEALLHAPSTLPPSPSPLPPSLSSPPPHTLNFCLAILHLYGIHVQKYAHTHTRPKLMILFKHIVSVYIYISMTCTCTWRNSGSVLWFFPPQLMWLKFHAHLSHSLTLSLTLSLSFSWLLPNSYNRCMRTYVPPAGMCHTHTPASMPIHSAYDSTNALNQHPTYTYTYYMYVYACTWWACIQV